MPERAPVLVTGGTGQLAVAIAEASPDARVVGRPAFDFDRPETLDALFAHAVPKTLINAAAYTAVDAAETDERACARANTDGPARLAALCRRHGTDFIHVSTDYVFDGELGRPYREDDATNPRCVYGQTKRAGEVAVLEANPAAIVVRTAWVYGPIGKNFVRSMLAAARRGAALRVVGDQRGAPTAAPDLARIILVIADKVARGEPVPRGIVHATNAGETTWHGFAAEIFRVAAGHGLSMPSLTSIATADWPTAARRPPDSRLDCTRLREHYGLTLPPWEASVREIVDRLLSATDDAGPRPA